MPFRLNATAAALLGFLHDGPRSGYDLYLVAQKEIGNFWSINQSQIYRELTALTKAGLVEPGEKEARQRQEYTLTAEGLAAFAEWTERMPDIESIRSQLLLAMYFGGRITPAHLGRILREHRRIHADRLAEYEEQRAAHDAAVAEGEIPEDPYRMAALDYGIEYERAALRWFRRLPPNMRGGYDSR
jgi:DNA-binding PadR family transcriptional regulator